MRRDCVWVCNINFCALAAHCPFRNYEWNNKIKWKRKKKCWSEWERGREREKTARITVHFSWLTGECWALIIHILFDTWAAPRKFYFMSIRIVWGTVLEHRNSYDSLISALFYLCKLIRKVLSASSVPCDCVQCMNRTNGAVTFFYRYWNVRLYYTCV